ncbi:hypothetical protein CHU95_06560 [Niveispirillum lacus]|uniref:Putative auto-transporter adhesin head GIN domain-containing protein n=1 Tax=Niveispirillum lacus TaxID=1981099 RepID=A0A255Z357_9PROT|nr:DUF2807 domain-containing protein [Niveispirillum lacus]OYQ35917.1 hypothetical protein CHU95_06560 [Niveispirillum lacus]
MDGALSNPLPASLSNRPRLTPGVPAGGIAAILLALGIVGWGLAVGDSDGPQERHGSHFDIREPPAPPEPPEAPDMRVNPDVNPQMVERAVRDAMRGVEVDATRMEALREAQVGLAEAQRELAAAREELQRQGADAPAIAEGALRLAEMGVAAAAGAAKGAQDQVGMAEGSVMQSFDAPKGVQLVNIGGDISIERSSRADKVKVEIDNGANGLDLDVTDGVLTLRGRNDPQTGHASIRMTLPSDTDLTVAGLAGDLSIGGRSGAKLSVQLLRGDVSAERVGALSVDILESGTVSVERVDGPLNFRVQGAGELSVERAETAKLEVSGHATVSVGRVNDSLAVSIPGHAEMDIGRVNGPIRVDFPGAGRISIGEGEGELEAQVTGAGSLEFNGTAINPTVLASGAGNVHIARHQGMANIRNTGTGKTYVGD